MLQGLADQKQSLFRYHKEKSNLLTFEHHGQKQSDSYRLFIHEYVEGAAKRHDKQEKQKPNLQKKQWHENKM